jgi:hypothetical protein
MTRILIILLGLAVAGALNLGCKPGGDGSADEVAPTPAPVVDDAAAASGPEQAWAWMGLQVDLGEQVNLTPDFLRVEDPAATRDSLAEHYGAQLTAAGWERHSSTPGEAFRTDVYHRADLKLTLAAGDLSAGGAGIGITLGQHWAALALPRDGALEIIEEPAVAAVVFPGEVDLDAKVAVFDAALTAAGWVQDRVEPAVGPDSAASTRVVWYRQDIRALRLEVLHRDDGKVQVGIQVGWR